MPADALAERWPRCDDRCERPVGEQSGRRGVLAEQQWSSSSSAIAARDTCSCPGRVSLGQWDFTRSYSPIPSSCLLSLFYRF
jgi:hypothetical protein